MAVYFRRLPPASASQRRIHALPLVDALQQGGGSSGEEAPQWLRHSGSLNEAGETQTTMIKRSESRLEGRRRRRRKTTSEVERTRSGSTPPPPPPAQMFHATELVEDPGLRAVGHHLDTRLFLLSSVPPCLSQKRTQSLFQSELQGDLKLGFWLTEVSAAPPPSQPLRERRRSLRSATTTVHQQWSDSPGGV